MADRHAREKARWRGRMRLGRLAFWLIALACCLAPPAFAACVLGKVAELPVEMAGTRPLVTAKINGAEVKFLADSGAFFSMITPATATQFNLKRHPEFGLTIRGVGGDVTPSVATVDRLTLAGVDVPRVDFLVGGGEPGAGAVGIFGQNVLGLADVEYDLANGVIRLVQPRGCGDSALAYWAGSTPFSTIGIQPPPNAPVLDRLTPLTTGFAYVNGQKIRVVFDTGASTSVLSLKAAAGIGITPTTTGVVDAGLAQGIGRHMVSSWIAPIASFRIGGEEIKNTRLRIGAAGLDDIDMLLGADFFLSHRVYVANRQHKLYFTYNGGPVFRLDDATLVQAGQNQAPQASPVVADDKAAPTDAEGFARPDAWAPGCTATDSLKPAGELSDRRD